MMVTVLLMRGEGEQWRQKTALFPMARVHDILVLPRPVILLRLVELLLVALTELQVLPVVRQIVVHRGVHVVTLLPVAVTQLGQGSVGVVKRVQPRWNLLNVSRRNVRTVDVTGAGSAEVLQPVRVGV